MSGRLVHYRAFCTFGSYATRLIINSALAFFSIRIFLLYFCLISFHTTGICSKKQHPICGRSGWGAGGGGVEGAGRGRVRSLHPLRIYNIKGDLYKMSYKMEGWGSAPP
ncbi:hypothetical protein XENTR_v10015167 [Xenopus tropicalis]|nr:hypothetical protein XENTR_v10015167 [Xenopus tropicalis]